MTSNSNNGIKPSSESVHHSDPIPIASRFGRGRSTSMSSVSSGSSSAFDIPTPMSSSANSQHAIPSPTGSPILSYFLGQSPTKAHPSATFPFKRSLAPPTVLEGVSVCYFLIYRLLIISKDEETDKDLPVAAHMRRASLNVAGRFGQQPYNGPIPDSQRDRGTGLLRRLSLGGSSFAKVWSSMTWDSLSYNTHPQIDTSPTTLASPPSPPPNTATSPSFKSPTHSTPIKHRRATTSGENGRTRRAPSPMGERILKGHFDGFN